MSSSFSYPNYVTIPTRYNFEMEPNPLEFELKSKSAEELLNGASSSGISIYGWVFLVLLVIVIGIGIYKILKDK